MGQSRLYDISMIHIHKDEDVDLSIIANQFINKPKVRQNTFSLNQCDIIKIK